MHAYRLKARKRLDDGGEIWCGPYADPRHDMRFWKQPDGQIHGQCRNKCCLFDYPSFDAWWKAWGDRIDLDKLDS